MIIKLDSCILVSIEVLQRPDKHLELNGISDN